MEIIDNERGGKTVILVPGDDPDKVEPPHRRLLTKSLRSTFADPPEFFRRVAARCPFPNMRLWPRRT
jgi:hypothetical protein